MDKTSDSGSDDLGSSPDGVTNFFLELPLWFTNFSRRLFLEFDCPRNRFFRLYFFEYVVF